MKPIATIYVGLPGLGKSTLVKFHCKIYDNIDMSVFIYSTDNYIEKNSKMRGLTYNDVFEETIKEATQMCNEGLTLAIKNKHDIVFDQTNLGVKKRKKIINRMKQAGYQVRCVCIVPPEPARMSDQKDWKFRLENRPGKNIPNHVLANMIESYVVPTIEEGFDMISFYNMHGALLAVDNGEE